MEQYIDKSAVVAEIERLREEEYPCDTFEESTGYYNALDEIATFLDTIEVKETDEELAESEDELIRKEIIAFLKENLETGSAEETWSLSGLERWISWLEKQGMKEPAAKVESKFKVKYAGNEYNVFETKDIAGVTFYGIEDEPNHIDYVKAENCEIISVYAIKENGSPYPTKPAVFSEKKPKRMISAEAKEAMYDKPACVGRNDTLLDLLNKMPSYITVDGIFYHFILRKTALAYTAYYAGEEEGSGKVIFAMTAFSPIDLLNEMLDKLKEEGLLDG